VNLHYHSVIHLLGDWLFAIVDLLRRLS